jgi:hypothetical protein
VVRLVRWDSLGLVLRCLERAGTVQLIRLLAVVPVGIELGCLWVNRFRKSLR